MFRLNILAVDPTSANIVAGLLRHWGYYPVILSEDSCPGDMNIVYMEAALTPDDSMELEWIRQVMIEWSLVDKPTIYLVRAPAEYLDTLRQPPGLLLGIILIDALHAELRERFRICCGGMCHLAVA